MFKPVLLSSTALLALVVSTAARAQVDPASESVIVTATRVPTPATQIASSVTVIDADEISARQLRSLPGVLATVPGLNVVQTGGEGGQTSLFTRGTNSNHTKVLLDGIDISDPSTPAGAVDLGKMLAGDVQRVEVMRGPGSSLYGSDAIGGVVNIITQDGNGPLALSGMVEGGSFDTFNQSASAGGSDGDFHYHASIQHLHAWATPVTPLDQLRPGEARNDDYFDSVTASTKLRYDVTGNFDLGLVGRWSESLSHTTGEASDPFPPFASFPSPTQTRNETQQYQTRATAHWNLGWIDQTLGLAYSSTSNDSQDVNFGPGRNSADRIKLDWQGNIGLTDGETLVLGAETYRDAIHQPLSAGATTNAGYAELQSAVDGVFFNSASIRYDDNSRAGDKFTWHVAPAVVIADTGTKFKASVGTGFKAPALEQLYQNFPPFFFANPNLKPETSLGYDLGVEQALGPVTAGVTFFHMDIKNLIDSDPTFTTVINVGRARTQGFETFVAWQAMETFNLRADYTITEADDATSPLELLRRPRNKASVTANWRLRPDVGIDATLLYIGPWIDGSRDFSIPRLKTGGYATVDLAGHWDVTENFTLFVRGDNLLNRHYQNPVGFLGPEQAFYAGVQAHL